jgi:uncharacterized SAM-binding protein YcdF (DUF218 family)
MIRFIYKIVRWPILILIVLGLAAWFYPEKFLTTDSGPVKADALILLGGGQHERAVRAAQLYKAHAAPRVIISGAGDAEINRRQLIANGVPPQAIEVENKSTTTRENALFTAKLLRADKIRTAIIVTSWYHARRAQKTFQHYVPGVYFFSRPSYFGFAREDWKKSGINRHMRLEFLKLPGYWIRYGVNPF